MNGFAGLLQLKNRTLANAESKPVSLNSIPLCGDLAAGWAAYTADKLLERTVKDFTSNCSIFLKERCVKN